MSGIATIYDQALEVKALVKNLTNTVNGMLEPSEANDELILGFSLITGLIDTKLVDILKIADNIK
jgi:hypothetical protein